MAETFLSLTQELARQVGTSAPAAVTSQTGEALRLVNWINEAYRYVQNLRQDWKFRWAEGSFNIAAAVTNTDDERTYDPSGVFDHWDRESVRIYKTSIGQSDETNLRYMPYREWRKSMELGAIASGRPSAYTILPNNQIRFDRYPDAIYTVVIDYRKNVASMTANTDEPLIPDEYRFILVYRAKRSYAIYEEAAELKQDAEVEYREILQRLYWDQLPDEDLTVAAV